MHSVNNKAKEKKRTIKNHKWPHKPSFSYVRRMKLCLRREGWQNEKNCSIPKAKLGLVFKSLITPVLKSSITERQSAEKFSNAEAPYSAQSQLFYPIRTVIRYCISVNYKK